MSAQAQNGIETITIPLKDYERLLRSKERLEELESVLGLVKDGEYQYGAIYDLSRWHQLEQVILKQIAVCRFCLGTGRTQDPEYPAERKDCFECAHLRMVIPKWEEKIIPLFEEADRLVPIIIAQQDAEKAQVDAFIAKHAGKPIKGESSDLALLISKDVSTFSSSMWRVTRFSGSEPCGHVAGLAWDRAVQVAVNFGMKLETAEILES